MKIHAGILDGHPRPGDMVELTILALTPGIPFEWVVHCGRIGDVRKSALKRNLRDATPDQVRAAKDNAASVTDDDAFAMLRVIPRSYRGAVPLYAQLWLQATPQTDAAVAKELGLYAEKVRRWRIKSYFDPLTGERIS